MERHGGIAAARQKRRLAAGATGTLDVPTALRGLNRERFSLDDIYSRERDLAALHPANRHVRDKIRQQLQVLRDKGLLVFLGRGRYRLR